MPDDEKIVAIRNLLPATSAGIYLNVARAGPLPSETQRAMDEIAEHELTLGRASRDIDAETEQRMAEARAGVAAVIAADVDSVALTHSTAEGLAFALATIEWRSGDRIVTTSEEDPDWVRVVRATADRFDLAIDVVDLGDREPEPIVAAFEGVVDERTRAVVLSHVTAATGALLPIRRVIDRAHEDDAVAIVDGSQAAGAIPVDVEATGADFYAVPAHKWLLGPEGMAAMGLGQRPQGTFAPAGGARQAPLEMTGVHGPSVVGFARSCGWLSMYVGLPWAHERTAALTARASERLLATPGVNVLTPPGTVATILTFRIHGWRAADAVDELGRRVFAIVEEVPALDAIRASIGFWNTDDELDRFLAGVELLAAHTPETLPQRQRLTVLAADSPLR